MNRKEIREYCKNCIGIDGQYFGNEEKPYGTEWIVCAKTLSFPLPKHITRELKQRLKVCPKAERFKKIRGTLYRAYENIDQRKEE